VLDLRAWFGGWGSDYLRRWGGLAQVRVSGQKS
jgi:hypothetical protein